MRYFWIIVGLAYLLGIPACVIATGPKAAAEAAGASTDFPATNLPSPDAAASAPAAGPASGMIRS